MKITIVAERIELTTAIKDYVKKKVNSLEKLLDTSGDKEALARIELGKETRHHQKGIVFMVEVHFSYRKEKHNVKTKAADLYAAIDEMKDELGRELKANKDKHSTRAKAGARKIKELLHAA